METLVQRLPEIVIQIIVFLFALSVHEAAHGWMAYKLGDPTAKWLRRITLNPIKHIDLIGTIILPLFLAFTGAPVFGWAKPVPYVPRNLRKPRRDSALVAAAGPGSNLIVCLLSAFVLVVAKHSGLNINDYLGAIHEHGAASVPGIVAPVLYFVYVLMQINLILAVFNLIPVPPLDGSGILAAFLPYRFLVIYNNIRPYGFFIIYGLVILRVLDYLLIPFIWLLNLILSI